MRKKLQLTKILLNIFILTVFSSPCFSEDKGTTYYCIESNVQIIGFDGEVTNHTTSKFVLNVKNNIVTVDIENVNERDRILYPYWINPRTDTQFWVRNSYCDLKLISLDVNPQQLVCNIGHTQGVVIRNFKCSTF